MNLQQWIALAILVLPNVGFGLTLLSHTGFMAKHAAWQAIVGGAINVVAQIEAELKANPNMNAAQLVAAGIAELRTVYAQAFAKLGGTAVPDAVLQLLFQRVAARLPANVDAAIVQFLGGGSSPGGATTVSGAVSSVPLRRGVRFIRSVGPVVLARETSPVRRLLLWLAWPFVSLARLVARLLRPRPFVFTFDGEVLG